MVYTQNLWVNSIQSPNTFYRFNASNNTKALIPDVYMNSKEFSYEFMLNLSTYEDGSVVPRNGNGINSIIFSMGANGAIWAQVDNDGELILGLRTNAPNVYPIAYINPFNVNTNRWYYVALVYNQGEVSIYKNGIMVFDQQVFPEGSSINISYPADGIIGSAGYPLGIYPNLNPLNGSLADFILYNNTLSFTQIENQSSFYSNIGNDPYVLNYYWVG